MDKKQREKTSTKYSRRRFLKLASFTGGALALSACVAPATPGAEQGSSQNPTPEKVTISWWNQYKTASTKAVIPKIIDGYQQLYPNVKVDYEISGGPPGGGNYTEVLLARIAAGNPPNTATLFDPPVQFAARGSLTEIDAFIENAKWAKSTAFYDGPLNSCRWSGKTYGLPASAGAGCIFINAEKFDAQGISTKREDFPTTWEGLLELSAKLTQWENGDLKQAGLVPWATAWLKPVWSGLNGSQLFDAENTQYTITSQENVAWISYWLNWLEKQYQGDIEKLNLYGNYSDAYPTGAFQLGVSAMVQSGSWACSDAEIPFAWEVTKFPVGPSGSKSKTGYWPNWFAMPAGLSYAQESFLFCEYFCTKGWEIWYTGIMDTPAWKDFPSGVLTQALVDNVGQERAQEIHNFFASYLADTVDMWNSPVESFASDTLDAAIDEVLHKTKTPDQALADAQDAIQAKLDETLKS